MAIKGKKKKSSAARRRPAAAPRPTATSRRKLPWYKTGKGLGIAGGILALIVVGVIAIVMAAGGDSDVERRSRTLETYTSDMRAFVQRLYDPLGIVVRSAADPANADAGEVEDAEAALLVVQADAATLAPPVGGETAHRVFQEALSLYIEAAGLLKNALEVDDNRPFATSAAQLVSRGDALFSIATADLDGERAEVNLDPSGFGLPSTAAVTAQPTVQPTGSPTGGGDRRGGNNRGSKDD
jgi:hypothetical protein